MAKDINPKIISKKHLARLEKERIQNRYIVTISIVILVIVLAVVGYGILDQTVLRGVKQVAKVGPDKITTTEFEKIVRYSRWQLIDQYNSTLALSQSFGDNPQFTSYFQSTLSQIQTQLSDPKIIGSAVLDQLISDRVIRQEAAKRGIVVTSAEVDTAMQEWFRYFPEGEPTPTEYPSAIPTSTLSPAQLELIATLPPTPDASLPTESPTAAITPTAAQDQPEDSKTVVQVEPTPTEYTLDAYRDNIAKYLEQISETKFTEADFRKIFESSLIRKKLQDEITKDLKPVEDQVWARHILVSDEETAKKVVERYQNGEKWAALAAEYSKDTSNKDNGGDLGWFGAGAMVAAFEKAAFSTNLGSISAPVQTEFGWHIIQVIAHEEKSLTNEKFTEVKNTDFQTWLTSALETVEVIKTDYWESVVPSDPTLGSQ